MDTETFESQTPLPKTYTGLQFQSASSPPSLVTLPTPSPNSGTVIVKPLFAIIVQYANEIFTNGNPRGFKYPLPLVPGGNCIARVAAVPPDATALRPGQLVYVELAVRARDAPGVKVLRGFNEGTSEGTRRLFGGGDWRDGVWATLATAPLEGVHTLREDVLVGRLGYALEELGAIGQLIVPYAGLADIGVKAGDTVLVAPATGSFGGAALHVALAMGARVIAMGRNKDALEKLKKISPRLETVAYTGNEHEDVQAISKFGPVDVYFDISPPKAGKSFIKTGFQCLKVGGRMSLMGGIKGDLEVPYGDIVHKGITIKGSFMNTSEHVKDLIKTIETGALQVGTRAGMTVGGKFGLQDWEKAFETAAAEGGVGKSVFFVPNQE